MRTTASTARNDWTVFIANDTRQNWTFQYRLRGGEGGQLLGPFMVEIPSGQQIDIGRGWSQDQAFYVVEQLETHGARDASDTKKPMGKHLGLIYRISAPVKSDEIEMGHAAVLDTQERRSANEATKAALGFDRIANGGRKGQRSARTTEVEVQQLTDPRDRPTGKEINFRLGVDTEGNAQVPMAS